MPIERKTGPGYAYILCDVCGRKIRQKDAILITDKYNTQSSLLVCKDDVDRTNPQNIPYSVSETQIQNPKLLRSERPDVNTINENSSRAPSAPRNLVAIAHPLNNTVLLQWTGPDDSGTDPITGYVIIRAEPQLGSEEVLVANTGQIGVSYEDIDSTTSGEYSYKVQAINAYGTGPESNRAFFPIETVNEVGFGYKYLTTSDTNLTIAAGDGRYIIIRD